MSSAQASRSARGSRSLRACLVLLLCWAAATVPAVVSAPPARAGGPPAGSSQLITVETASPSATTGTLRGWERSGGGWRLVRGPYPVLVGAGGVGQAREGSPVTPAGTYPLTGAFGRQADPGTTMPWFQTDVQDWWDENPASPTYNTHVRQAASPGGASENLYRAGAVYDYAVVIGYNAGRVPGAGSGIFLHVSNGTPTAGCVSMDRAALTDLLRWLRPAAQPSIMIDVAHVVNAIADAWYRVGGAAGALGLPTTAERALGDGRGISQWFEHGAVYWTGATGAHPVVNADLQAWAASGYERGPLGYPSTDEWGLPDGRGISQWFERGAVYWSAATGAHRMTGAILQNWADQGYEGGPLGYPATDEWGLPDGRGISQWFEHGAVYWTAATGAHRLTGAVLQAWAGQGYEGGALGYPTSDPRPTSDGGTRVDFQHGSLTQGPDGVVR